MALTSLLTPLLLTTTLIAASLSHLPDIDYNPITATAQVPAERPPISGSVVSAAGIAAVALAAAGVGGFVQQQLAPEASGYIRRKTGRVRMLDVVERAGVVWAAYFAALELGGVRAVGIVGCLLAVGGGWKEWPKRKAVAGVLALALVWDLWVGRGWAVVGVYCVLGAALGTGRSVWPVLERGEVWVHKVAVLAGAVLGGFAVVGWAVGVQVQGRAEVGFWAAMVGGVAMLVGRGIPGVWECGVTMGLAVGAGWCAGLINAVELMSELGLGALTVAGMYPCRSSCVC